MNGYPWTSKENPRIAKNIRKFTDIHGYPATLSSFQMMLNQIASILLVLARLIISLATLSHISMTLMGLNSF